MPTGLMPAARDCGVRYRGTKRGLAGRPDDDHNLTCRETPGQEAVGRRLLRISRITWKLPPAVQAGPPGGRRTRRPAQCSQGCRVNLDHSQDKHASSAYSGARVPLCQTFILRLAAILADVLLLFRETKAPC